MVILVLLGVLLGGYFIYRKFFSDKMKSQKDDDSNDKYSYGS